MRCCTWRAMTRCVASSPIAESRALHHSRGRPAQKKHAACTSLLLSDFCFLLSFCGTTVEHRGLISILINNYLTISFNHLILRTEMTIAKNWIVSSVDVEGRQVSSPNFSPSHRTRALPEQSGVFCQVGATGRSRTA